MGGAYKLFFIQCLFYHNSDKHTVKSAFVFFCFFYFIFIIISPTPTGVETPWGEISRPRLRAYLQRGGTGGTQHQNICMSSNQGAFLGGGRVLAKSRHL